MRMINYSEAKKMGIDACVNQLGRDFVKKHRENAVSAYGDEEDHAYCFVGVNDKPSEKWDGGDVILDGGSGTGWPDQASCNVWYSDGRIEFFDCVLPEV